MKLTLVAVRPPTLPDIIIQIIIIGEIGSTLRPKGTSIYSFLSGKTIKKN